MEGRLPEAGPLQAQQQVTLVAQEKVRALDTSLEEISINRNSTFPNQCVYRQERGQAEPG